MNFPVQLWKFETQLVASLSKLC